MIHKDGGVKLVFSLIYEVLSKQEPYRDQESVPRGQSPCRGVQPGVNSDVQAQRT